MRDGVGGRRTRRGMEGSSKWKSSSFRLPHLIPHPEMFFFSFFFVGFNQTSLLFFSGTLALSYNISIIRFNKRADLCEGQEGRREGGGKPSAGRVSAFPRSLVHGTWQSDAPQAV
jgi:hypothetical protein